MSYQHELAYWIDHEEIWILSILDRMYGIKAAIEFRCSKDPSWAHNRQSRRNKRQRHYYEIKHLKEVYIRLERALWEHRKILWNLNDIVEEFEQNKLQYAC